MTNRLSILAAVGLAAIAIASCGGDEPPETVVELEDQLGFSDEGIVERQSRVEGLIQRCMKDQGFDYVPVDPLAERAALTGKARMSDEEFIEQFGYGISTMFGRATAQTDPNQRIRKSLLPADQRAYDRALFGENPGLTFKEAIDNDQATELGGCTKEATEAVFGGATVLVALQGKFDTLESRIQQDQRMVRAIESWSECMADKGFRYTEPEQIDADVIKRFKAILGPSIQSGATTTLIKNQVYNKAALNQLQQDEVRLGRADLACEKSEIEPVELEVRPQYEEAFRKQNTQLISQVRPVATQ